MANLRNTLLLSVTCVSLALSSAAFAQTATAPAKGAVAAKPAHAAGKMQHKAMHKDMHKAKKAAKTK
jgi:hypothetical protein